MSATAIQVLHALRTQAKTPVKHDVSQYDLYEYLHGEHDLFGKKVNIYTVRIKENVDLKSGGKYRVGWVLNDQTTQCMRCNSHFTVLNRRHHCRFCGYLMCGHCSVDTACVPELKEAEQLSRRCSVCRDYACRNSTTDYRTKTPDFDDKNTDITKAAGATSATNTVLNSSSEAVTSSVSDKSSAVTSAANTTPEATDNNNSHISSNPNAHGNNFNSNKAKSTSNIPTANGAASSTAPSHTHTNPQPLAYGQNETQTQPQTQTQTGQPVHQYHPAQYQRPTVLSSTSVVESQPESQESVRHTARNDEKTVEKLSEALKLAEEERKLALEAEKQRKLETFLSIKDYESSEEYACLTLSERADLALLAAERHKQQVAAIKDERQKDVQTQLLDNGTDGRTAKQRAEDALLQAKRDAANKLEAEKKSRLASFLSPSANNTDNKKGNDERDTHNNSNTGTENDDNATNNTYGSNNTQNSQSFQTPQRGVSARFDQALQRQAETERKRVEALKTQPSRQLKESNSKTDNSDIVSNTDGNAETNQPKAASADNIVIQEDDTTGNNNNTDVLDSCCDINYNDDGADENDDEDEEDALNSSTLSHFHLHTNSALQQLGYLGEHKHVVVSEEEVALKLQLERQQEIEDQLLLEAEEAIVLLDEAELAVNLNELATAASRRASLRLSQGRSQQNAASFATLEETRDPNTDTDNAADTNDNTTIDTNATNSNERKSLTVDAHLQDSTAHNNTNNSEELFFDSPFAGQTPHFNRVVSITEGERTDRDQDLQEAARSLALDLVVNSSSLGNTNSNTNAESNDVATATTGVVADEATESSTMNNEEEEEEDRGASSSKVNNSNKNNKKNNNKKNKNKKGK